MNEQTRTVMRDNSALFLQLISGAIVASPLLIGAVTQRWDQSSWVWLAIGLFFLGITLCLPSTRVEVRNGIISVSEVRWWKTTTHSFTADSPPPELVVSEYRDSEGDRTFHLKLVLASGGQVEITQSQNRDIVVNQRLTLLRLWAGG